MRDLRNLAVFAIVLIALAGAATPAPAAESYDNCVGFIDALPATITTQGTWCLRHALTTAATGGNIIEIQTNNVTIDCNGFKIVGLAGGVSTNALGIYTASQTNITVRNCTIIGFEHGITLNGGGNIVENNLLDLNRFVGIATSGAGNIVRRNSVLNTGGKPISPTAYAIYAEADIIDNVVDAVYGADSVTNFNAYGIYAPTDTGVNLGTSIQGNRIRNLTPKGTGTAAGIASNGVGVSVRDNVISQASSTSGTGVTCADNTSHVRDNVIVHYSAGIQVASCDNAGGNSINP